VRDLAGRLGAGDGEDLSDRLGRHGRLAGRARLVPEQAFDALFGKALLPAPNRGAARADALGDRQHGQALVGAEDDARPLDVLVRTVPVGDDRAEALTITGGKDDARGLGHAPRLAYLRRNVNPQIASVHSYVRVQGFWVRLPHLRGSPECWE
jgi:hypothetical protein